MMMKKQVRIKSYGLQKNKVCNMWYTWLKLEFGSLNSYFESLNSYFESLNSYFECLNSYFQSLNSYFETVADTRGGGGGGLPNNGTKYHNLCCLRASGTRKHTNI